MKQYLVTGMTCAACSARVEKAVNAVEGVRSCSVSLLTNSMGVEGEADPAAVVEAVRAAGYDASLKEASGKKTANTSLEEELKDRETPLLKKRLIASLIFLVILMYFSMGHMMWGFPLPSFFEGNHVAMGLVQLLLTVIIMVINQRFFISGFKSLLHKSPNMDTLVALGASAAFIYSTIALFMMTSAQTRGDMEFVEGLMDEFYFESAAMILTLITLGKMLEARSKGRTTDALKGLMKLSPKTVTLLVNGEEKVTAIEEVVVGDVFVVRPGESIPVDGKVIKGDSAVDESALTGESIPVSKSEGSLVSAGTLNQSGFISCVATRVGEDTTLSQIIRMVSDAAATKAPIAKIADKVSGVFVPTVITLALITAFAWLLAGKDAGFALARAISVLVISCPCALGLATPVAIMVGNGVGAKNGILFKTAISLEKAGKAQIVALDKTGTITKGEPNVTDIIPAEGISDKELLELAYCLEAKSEHPLAKAIVKRAREDGLSLKEAGDFKIMPGNGLCGELEGKMVYGGNLSYISTKAAIPSVLEGRAGELADEGKTPLYFSCDGKAVGVIGVADVIKEDSSRAVSELKNMGMYVVMLTGDNEKTARAIAKKAGVDEVISGVLPDGKESVIRRLQEKGEVIMVGDGINDAPALTRADIGVAIGAGADVAVDAADVVLMKSSLLDLTAAIRLSRRTLRIIHENLFWAFFYNSIGIPLAAGVFINALGWQLNPMFGAAAMSLSSFCVVTNALRLNLFKIHDPRHDHKIKRKNDNKNKKENNEMTKTMTIEGMMCGHCEMHTKKALEALEGVVSAQVSHESGTAVVTLSSEVSDDALKKAVEAEGYTVKAIK